VFAEKGPSWLKQEMLISLLFGLLKSCGVVGLFRETRLLSPAVGLFSSCYSLVEAVRCSLPTCNAAWGRGKRVKVGPHSLELHPQNVISASL
jgi:hypothetical protein